MKTLPRFWRNQFYNIILGTALSGLCLSSFAQTTPLESPKQVEYPGIIQTFEKLIQIDFEKIQKRTDLLTKNGKTFSKLSSTTNLDLEPDFLNSIILHSDPGYLKMASTDRCRFYEAILTDLLKSSDGKIKNILMTYLADGKRESAIIPKKDFLSKVVSEQCPETQKNIAAFQIKTFPETLKTINFDIPNGIDQCKNIHFEWLTNPKTPFICQIHEYIKEAKLNGGDPKDLQQRKTISKILETKLSLTQKDYIENVCKHLDDENLFCDEFLNVSFWTKIANGIEDSVYAEDICGSNPGVMNSVCLARLKKEQDLCLYPFGKNPGLRPQPNCDQISLALNYSSFKANFRDCPGNSDQMIATNMGRILNHFSPIQLAQQEGTCSSLSAGVTYIFNKKFDNDENWGLEACYDDKINGKEICSKTFFGKYENDPASYTNVVASILKETRGIDDSTKCEMVENTDYNPILLKFKSGCFIVFEKDNCHISQCKHKIILNDRPVDLVRIKGKANLAYFPSNVMSERFSQHYLLTRDFKKSGRQISNLSSVHAFFKKNSKGIIHGVGCAEDLLPSFFKTYALNQCTPMPFIVNGVIKDKDKVTFVTRTAGDSLQAPRLISWSSIYSAVKSYQKKHPIKQWTMYGLD